MPDAAITPVVLKATGSAVAVDPSIYARLYESSVRDPERFWAEHGRPSAGSSPTAAPAIFLTAPVRCVSAGTRTAPSMPRRTASIGTCKSSTIGSNRMAPSPARSRSTPRHPPAAPARPDPDATKHDNRSQILPAGFVTWRFCRSKCLSGNRVMLPVPYRSARDRARRSRAPRWR
jgi:hypothetical protein